MEHDFWHRRWQKGQIGFHQPTVNSFLQSFWERVSPQQGEPVFVPLCGKSLDMIWLRQQGHSVLGIELNEAACDAFFTENALQPEVSIDQRYKRYHVDGIELLCGDFFQLDTVDLQGYCKVYDRAALVALPPAMRAEYAAHLCQMLPEGSQILLVTLEFDAETGPPFNVSAEEVLRLFGQRFDIQRIHEDEPQVMRDEGRLEVTWLLKDKS